MTGVHVVDLQRERPPEAWGVRVDLDAIDALAAQWATDRFDLPRFDYPGTPAHRDQEWWFDYVTLAVSVLACLWPPEGDEVWHAELDGVWLDDAPGIFATFTRQLGDRSLLETVQQLNPEESAAWFAGRGHLQLVAERAELLQEVAAAVRDRWDGTARNLAEEADRSGPRIAQLLVETMPGYADRASTPAGLLPFDKLAHLAAAIMAAGLGWGDTGFTDYEDFPVYPDYMLPRVFRHFGVLGYSDALARKVDTRQLVTAGSEEEWAIRWATVYAGAELRRALHRQGSAVPAPALDYRLWHEAVLGPNADHFGEHHRTVTLLY